MLVTFGREATTELRERVRERLVSAERGLADPAPARGPGPTRCSPCWPAATGRRRRGGGPPGPADPARSPSSTRPPSPPLTSSASACSPGSGWPATPTRTRCSSSPSTICSPRWWTTSTCASTRDHGTGSPAFSRTEALSLARRAVYDEQARLEPVDAEPGSTAAVRLRFAQAVRAEVTRRKRAGRLLHLRRHADPAGRRAGRPGAGRRPSGCGPDSGWCWSTSSRTPTRCSGRSCGGPSTAT